MKTDGTVYIDTEIDISGFQKGSRELEAAAKRMADTVERIGKGLGESIGQTISAPETGIEQMTDDAKDLSDALNKAAEEKAELAKQPITESVDTSVNIGGFRSGSQELETAARDMISTAEGLSKDIGIAVQKLVNAFVKENQAISEQQKKVRDLQQQIAELSEKRVETDAFKATNADVEKLEKSLNAAKNQKDELLSSGGAYTQANTSSLTNQLSSETQRLKNMNNQLSTSYADLQQRLNNYQNQLQATQDKTEETGNSTNNLGKSTNSFGKRLSRLISGALIFNVISSGLRSMTQYFGKALKSNTEFSEALAKLKAAFMTAFQPIYELAVPALTTLMRIMTAAITIIGQFFSAISGKSYAQMKNNAKALNDQTKAIKGVGGAAKDAGKQLMAFDELNVLNDQKETGGGGGSSDAEISPDFSGTDEFSEKIKKIAEDVLLVGIGFALWKISKSLPGTLGDILGKIGLVVIAVGFLKMAWDGFMDAWENGIDWSNLTQILIGVAGAAIAIGLAFGTTAAAVVLLAGGIALVVLAIKDWLEKGELSNEMLVALIAGIMGIGGAIALLSGPSGWIALIVAAVVAAIVAIVAKGDEIKAWFLEFWNNISEWAKDAWENIKSAFSSVGEFFSDVFSKAWDFVISIGKGAVNEVIGFINGMISAITDGVNFVINSINSLGFTVPSWVPEIGGSRFGFNISPITAYQIPMLAKGAVIPPNAPFAAILGDQRNGTNIEAPEDLIRKIVREEAGSNERLEELLNELIRLVANIKVGDDVIGRAASRYNRTNSIARGW